MLLAVHLPGRLLTSVHGDAEDPVPLHTVPPVDIDADGAVSGAEWRAWFQFTDLNSDGALSAAELQAARQRARRARAHPVPAQRMPELTLPAAVAGGADLVLHRLKRITVLLFGSWT